MDTAPCEAFEQVVDTYSETNGKVASPGVEKEVVRWVVECRIDFCGRVDGDGGGDFWRVVE